MERNARVVMKRMLTSS
ncbi:hypothetical protein seszw270L_add [Salmonella phage seszw]|nr:hypothetical protein seszw270L_add [Salmonella phage seszw]